MASPQKENGYTPIANELLEAMCGLQLSGHEWSVVCAIIRKTYGYNKKEDWVTNTQIASLTGLHRVRVSEAKCRLLAKGVVTENRNKLSLVKDYEKWKVLRKTVTGVTENRNKVLRKTVPTKDNKDKHTKDTSGEGVDKNKKQKKKSVKVDDMSNHNVLGAEVIYEMISIDPKNKTYYNNKTQRAACDFLIEEYGLAEVKNRIKIVEKTNGEPYFPTITTPVQLRDKWVQLEKAIIRHKKEAGQNQVAF
jgi:phage replication O-like protein O